LVLYDLVIRNGLVMDPASRFAGTFSVGVRDGKIATLTAMPISGKVEIDAAGLVVAPGFVDVHTHVDGNRRAGYELVKMGVTSAIAGNCGNFMWFDDPEAAKQRLHAQKDYDVVNFNRLDRDWSDLLQEIDTHGYPVNLGLLVGSATLRLMAGAADPTAPASTAQLAEMCQTAARFIEAGCFGVSFGVMYTPGMTRDELLALFRVAARYQAIAAVHPRYGGVGLRGLVPDALVGHEEIIDVAREADVRLQISHIAHQIAYQSRPYDDLTTRGIRMVDEARADGVDVMADCMPLAQNVLEVGLPLTAVLYDRLPQVESQLGRKIENVIFVKEGPHRGKGLTPDLYRQILQEAPMTALVVKLMKEDLVLRTLLPEWCFVGSDIGDKFFPAQARVVGNYVREHGAFTLMEALRKCTSIPAERFGLEQKGRIAVGTDADFTIFDADRISGTHTFMADQAETAGIEYVIVNGVAVMERGRLLDVLPGRALRRGASAGIAR
jgi:N-acyl-D-amino-acid deacylase